MAVARTRVKLVDGTCISMPDTPHNQACYLQPSTQAPGVGFPLARLVVVIYLATGVALDAAVGPHKGKGSGELALLRRLFEGFSPGDVMLADALYRNYFLLATLLEHRRVSKDELSALYARRWNVELDLRTPQDHHRHGGAELPDAADERETAVGPSAGL